jgi:hypothetical protein
VLRHKASQLLRVRVRELPFRFRPTQVMYQCSAERPRRVDLSHRTGYREGWLSAAFRLTIQTDRFVALTDLLVSAVASRTLSCG